jgi:hypothetical protein
MPVGAAIGSAVVGAGASIYGANKAAKASKDTLGAQQAQLDKVWGSVNPFLTAGNDALGRISDPAAVTANFQASPDYKYRLGQSLDAVTNNKAVNGLLRSGSALSAVTQKAGDMASSEFGNWWSRQSGLAGMGLDANRIGAGLAGTSVNALGANGANQGNAALTTANALGSAGGSIIDALFSKYGSGGSAGSSTDASSYNTMNAPTTGI